VPGSAPRSDDISPTAHYTGYVWARNGLSHPALATSEGRLLFNALRPPLAVSQAFGGPTLEGFLLARHHLIDDLLESAIHDGRVSVVIEIACGLSPRGWRFARRHGDRLTYVEADLPAMAARKRRLLEQAGSLTAEHRVVDIDALAEDGPLSLAAVAGDLDATQGLAVITEGLINYLDGEALTGLWRRTAGVLATFADGVYLSDVHLADENAGLAAQAFMRMLSLFVRGRVELHYRDPADALAALTAAGFGEAVLHSPTDRSGGTAVRARDARAVRIIEATALGATAKARAD
jgi:O-methyltransferase involved in polyketide biosynthesis